MTSPTRPEPMNSSPHHPKVKVSITLGSTTFVAGSHVFGKMVMECRADQGLGINTMMVELLATQELTSRDHSATSTFLQSRRLFQGPGLPPSNAVQAHQLPGDLPLPSHYYQAKRGTSTFLFRIPIPASSPSSINFSSGLARVRYEVQASVAVAWKGERRLVTDKREVDVVESFEEGTEPEGVVVGEHGKIWAQGRVVGGAIIAGESACVELQVKNHSTKKNHGLTVTLTRSLVLSGKPSEETALLINDILTTVPFRGREYIIPPGVEGVANLVFDVPKSTRGVRGGRYQGGAPNKTSDSLFEIQCIIGININMGFGSKDILLEIPVTVVHPAAIPELPHQNQYPPPALYPYAISPVNRAPSPYAYPALPMSPPLPTYMDQAQVWIPPPVSHTPHPHNYLHSPVQGQPYFLSPPSAQPRPTSAGPDGSLHVTGGGGYSMAIAQQPLLPLVGIGAIVEPEIGKGGRASRVTQHLHQSSRHRSVSPLSHRYPLPATPPIPIPIPLPARRQTGLPGRSLPVPPPLNFDLIPKSPPSLSPASVVHSPRPMLSPKLSYTGVDPVMHHSLNKSERVETLERLAAEEEVDTVLPADHYKTLPPPPVPSWKDKDRLLPPRARADVYFAALPEVPIPSEKTPPTPTLTAVTPSRNRYRRPETGQQMMLEESGLDALERRLLAEVGTRKMDLEEKRPDVRDVLMPMPISIPPMKGRDDTLNDSAISSLTLADHELELGHEFEPEPEPEADPDRDSDERTHRAGGSGDDRDSGGRGRYLKREEKTGSEKSGGDKKTVKKRGRDGDAKRKSAKGRVAAWLGGIDPDIPPPEDMPPLSPSVVTMPSVRSEPTPIAIAIAAPSENADQAVEVTSSAPNPRSSGFVSIETLKRDTIHMPRSQVERSDSSKDLWSLDLTSPEPEPAVYEPVVNVVANEEPPIPSTADVSSRQLRLFLRADRKPSPPSSRATPKPQVNSTALSREASQTSSTAAKPPLPPRKAKPSSARLPVFPPQRQDPEVKYDIRSARGGRGGKVTAVASIWASGAAGAAKPKDPKKPPLLNVVSKPVRPTKSDAPISAAATSFVPEPRLVELAGKRARPIVKSSSVPAIISSSHATPTLTSTASLARPPSHKYKSPSKVPPTISEAPSGITGKVGVAATAKVASPTKPPSSQDLAFGQARLRDLIRKYQGQAV